ncbi:MAG: hypothetical protein KGI27_01435 [Thaumarchaeota archaeon]|nr:hypothetical protein [Nitrososphaerota archaeon]
MHDRIRIGIITRTIIPIFVVLITVMSFSIRGAAAATLDVNIGDSACSDTPASGHPYCHIQSAINAASVGDTISVYPGSYTESSVCPYPMCGGAPTVGLFINKNNIILEGVDVNGNPIVDASNARATIAAAGKADFGFLNTVVADNVKISGLKFVPGSNTGYYKTIEVMGDNLTFTNNVIDNSGSTGTSTMYFDVNTNVLDPRINAQGAAGKVDNFVLTNNHFTGGEVTVAGGVGIRHTYTVSGTSGGFATYTLTWDPNSALVPGAVRTISGNEVQPGSGQTQSNGLDLVGYMPAWWDSTAYTIPTGPDNVTSNVFHSGLDNPILVQGGQNAANPLIPVINLATAFTNNVFDNAVLVTTDVDRTSVRADTGMVGSRSFPIYAIQSRIQSCIDLAHSDDFIWVSAGTYAENLSITKSVTLSGPNADVDPNTGTRVNEAIINGGHGFTITPLAGNIVIKGFTIYADNDGEAIYSTLTTGVDISGLTISYDIISGGVRAVTIENGGNGINIMHNRLGGDAYDIVFGDTATYTNVKIDNNTVNAVSETDGQFAIFMNVGGTINGFELSNNTIHDIVNIGFNITNGVVNGNTFDAPSSSGLDMQIALHHSTLSNNVFQGRSSVACLELWGSQYGIIPSNTVTVSGNTFDDCGLAGSLTYAIRLSPDIDHIIVTGNTISDAYDGISTIGKRTGGTLWDLTGNDIHINSNNIVDSRRYGVNNTSTGTLDATKNWWGSTDSSTIASKISGPVAFDPWYMNSGKTILSSQVSGTTINATAEDIGLSSTNAGQADMPSGTTVITLGNNTALNLASSVSTASGGNIVVAGSTIGLNSYTSGALSDINLAVPQNIGDQHISVEKAVKMSSGQVGTPITITNTVLPDISVSIPDGAVVLAPSGWDGKINPPKTGSSSGTAPSGFSVGNTVIEVGSPNVVLLFDKPTTLLLSGVTGNVGYKPAGSDAWTQITHACVGTYTSPSNPAFPGECFISNGVDTKIVTYHFTTFGSLTSASTGHGGSTPGFAPSFTTGFAQNEYPLTINNNAYKLPNYTNTGPFSMIPVGSPFTMSVMLYGDNGPQSVKHVSLALNIRGNFASIIGADAILAWDAAQPLQISDPNHFFGPVTANTTVVGNKLDVTFHGTFVKAMPLSDIGIRTWGYDTFSQDVYLINAIQSTENAETAESTHGTTQSSQSINPVPSPSATNQNTIANTNTSDLVTTVKEWAGYNPTSISDSQMLQSMGYQGSHIPSWVMKKVARYLVDGTITPDDFADVIKYLVDNHVIK